MRRDWPQAAVAYQESVTRALDTLGGVDLARAAEADRTRREALVAPALDRLDLRGLDPWGEEDESAAVMLAARAAGAVVLPWPLAHELAVPADLRGDVGGVHLTSGDTERLDHADLLRDAVAVDLDRGVARRVTAGAPRPAPLDPFASDVVLGAGVPGVDAARVTAMRMLLDAFWVAGALAAAVELAVTHARDRQQFGKPIGKFGEIRWRVADISLALDGLEELALHAWWLVRRGEARSADLLALRVQMIEAANTVLANGHQVLGAMGLCEEHDLTVIDRHLQSVLHRPAGRIRSTDLLARAVAAEGFDGIYPVAAWR
ncbi:acyl-CoA/acyl-ACP dehydrogenase [Microbispora sp. NEAU-D428]|uniref:acyl-CoA dehydrogenase family protein n=1 Tax=Microbispora sitophila TaxID=2771537 RepID=UPI001865F716|nr:acyl-CoA dehydrogenase family protein [Microbispora sitophila]MBE3016114.1 acyl-CoA/acyl-ACP dehydrogenase [Microbispora sitophila]